MSGDYSATGVQKRGRKCRGKRIRESECRVGKHSRLEETKAGYMKGRRARQLSFLGRVEVGYLETDSFSNFVTVSKSHGIVYL